MSGFYRAALSVTGITVDSTDFKYALCDRACFIKYNGFGGLRYIGYLLSWIEKPTWLNVIGMAILLWVIMVIKGLVSVCMFIYRCHKDPVFKRAAIQTGISWKDYKRLRGK